MKRGGRNGQNGAAAAAPSPIGRTPREDLDAEAALLESAYLVPGALAEILSFCTPNDFYSDANRHWLQAAALSVAPDGSVDPTVAAGVLRDGDLLRNAGGRAYLASILALTPRSTQVRALAERVRELARARRITARAHRIVAEGYADVGDVSKWGAESAADLAALATERAGWTSTSARIRGLGRAHVIAPTTYSTLNEALRGGLRAGKILVIGGAPGSGKTTWICQQALDVASLGLHVAVLAADEDADGLMVRLGQLLGFVREDLESGVPPALEAFERRLLEHAPHLQLRDVEETGASINAIADELSARARGSAAVLIVDSIQAVAAELDDDLTPREAVNRVMRSLKRAARKGLAVIALSEVSRGAYASLVSAGRIDDLAAFKESGGVEYGSATCMVFHSVKDEPDLVDVTMPKNRLGPRLEFRLQLDRRRAKFSEVPREAEGGDAENDVLRLDESILRLVRNAGPFPSANAIQKKHGGNRSAVLAAVRRLLEECRLVDIQGIRVNVGTGAQDPP